MNRFFVCALCCLLFFLSGCRSARNAAGMTQLRTPVPAAAERETERAPRGNENTIPDNVSGENETAAPAAFAEETRKRYAAFYHTSAAFEDLYMPQKVWLIGDKAIVQLVSFSGYHDATILFRACIERIEQSSLPGFGSVTVFDKSGQSISITVSSADFASVTALLR